MSARRGLVAVLLAATALLAAVPSAVAQDRPARVDVDFEVGPYDATLGDFPVTAVVVRGDVAAVPDVTVELRGTGERILWSATVPLTPPSTRVEVDAPVPVGAVTSAGLAQPVPVVAAAQVAPPPVLHSAQGGGGSGQLALSMVLIVALVAIVFRTPLPSASTQRWTR